MRIAELLASHVVDATGAPVGPVRDVRLVQDGPYIEGFGDALRVDALVVGAGGLAVRLGYHRHRVRGPAPVKWYFTHRERRARVVAWEQVSTWDGATVRLRCAASELPSVHDVY